jgi:sugar/nucleoside kinase (ribokinase family)
MNAVLFVGDINVDVIMGGLASLPVVDREITCESFDVTMGSTAVLAACAYAALGGRSAFLGLAGRDEYGEFMVRGLEARGVDTRLVRRTDRVRTGVTVNLVYGSTRTQVTYPGTIAEFEGRDVDAAALAGARHVHFAGPYQQTKFRPEIARLLDLAAGLGISASLDPQWDATERWEHMDEWLPRLAYLFVNDSEAVSITRASSPEAACLELGRRTRLAVVKTGPAGAMVAVDGALRRVPGYPVTVVDTTGAGDNFDAGFLYATLERGDGPVRACAFANAVAGLSCEVVGGTTARSTCDRVLTFMEEHGERI